ncbi:trans-resveratrol di-O-methyltransferase-like [Rhododendron vialii]|uniref:trans-resveratrol di-O-methyltransferase-like n=1 Tax=Rhododendron vialii TaxID=182163 RepID=UPI00265F1DB6|nr:trans-resveratrol di-O-methyltransferase-like [Rhododendron vialii]
MRSIAKMERRNDEREKALLLSQSHIWNQTYNLVNSMSLKCAVQLGIPDIIKQHGRPMPLSDLVSALHVNPSKASGVYRLMRLLVHSGFFTNQKVSENCEEEGYLLTPAAQLLLKDEPFSLAPYLLAMLDPDMFKPWHHMGEWFQNDDPTPFHSAYGMGLYDFCATKPRFNHLFNEAMASDSRLIAGVVVKSCKGVFEGLNSLVDVAGGTGTMAKAIADNFPNLKVTVLDLPHVVEELKGGDTENLKFVGGDMFGVIPSADAILLKWVFHNWSDEDGVKILQGCKEAVLGSKGGKVIIIDMVLETNNKGGKPNQTEPSVSVVNDKGDHDDKYLSDYTETQLCFDIVMLTVLPGKERTEKEWASLFAASGFARYKITPILGLRSLIEVYP